MKKYRILEGKIRMSKKFGKDRDLRINITYPPKILAWYSTATHVLTLSAKNSASQKEIDRIAKFLRPRTDREGDSIAFDRLYYGFISVKSYQKEAVHTQPFGVNERLLPVNVTTSTKDKARCVDIEVLRFVEGRLV
jgi:hypothetical protein